MERIVWWMVLLFFAPYYFYVLVRLGSSAFWKSYYEERSKNDGKI